MKNPFKSLFKRPKRIVFTFTETSNGKIKSEVKMDKGIPVGYALQTIDRFKAEITRGITEKAIGKGLNNKDTRTRPFIAKQTLGDIL